MIKYFDKIHIKLLVEPEFAVKAENKIKKL